MKIQKVEQAGAIKTPEEVKKQKDLHDSHLKINNARERTEYGGLTLFEMRRKHGISGSVGSEEIMAAYKADNIDTFKKRRISRRNCSST